MREDPRPRIENVELFAVIIRKRGLAIEHLAFAPGGRPAVFWTRGLAEGWLRELTRHNLIAGGRVETWRIPAGESQVQRSPS